MVEEDVDVLIVGARVAGSVLAALLGQEGRQVLVIDRATFPSGTLSTHFFRGEGCVGVLRRLGVLEEVLALGYPPLVREYNADAIDGSYTVDPPQTPGEVGFNLSVRREPLDGILVERARREPTVDVREATMLRAIEREGDRVTGAVIADGSGARPVRARLVIGADGHASRVAQLVGAPLQDEIPPSRAMYYRYIEGLEGPDGDPDGPEFSLGDDELVYVFPSDGGLACVALSLNLDDYRAVRTDSDRAFQDRVAGHPFIAGRVEKAGQLEQRLAFGSDYIDLDLVFPDPRGTMFNPENQSKRFHRRVTRLGLKGIRFHDLRHTYATLARRSGMDIKALSVRLGHENVATTMNLYQHIPVDMARESARSVADYILG